MKKIYLLALLCLFFGTINAQNKGVVFKIKYKPNRSYQMNMDMSMKLNANITGDTAVLEKLKSSGLTSPILADLELGMNANMKTGAPGADKSFPLDMDYKFTKFSVSANGKEAPIPPTISEKNIRISAHVGEDGLMMIDSANGKKTDDSTRQKMKQMMSLFQKQIQFPDRALKPGDSFTQSTPINLPLGKKIGGDIKINYSITYKLTSIADGKAYFDYTPNFSMDFNIQNKVTASISGTGPGKMVYSIKDNFPISNTGNFEMKIKINADKVNVDATGAITTNSTTTIN